FLNRGNVLPGLRVVLPGGRGTIRWRVNMQLRSFFGMGVLVVLIGSTQGWGATAGLPPIQKGNITVTLDPIATGMAAPDYAISPPGDPTRLFVIEQAGQLRLIKSGVLQPGSALNISSQLAGTFSNANEERGFLGLAFHPDFNNASAPGFHKVYTYESEPVGTG